MRYCGCGCGEQVKEGSEFRPGHDQKLKVKLQKRWRNEDDIGALYDLRQRGWVREYDPHITFGVELECIVNKPGGWEQSSIGAREEIAEMAPFDLTAGHSHTDTSEGGSWRITRDGSLRNNDINKVAVEFVSPVLRGKDGFNELEAVMNWIRGELNGEVNVSCGTHVHFGVKPLKSQAVADYLLDYAEHQGEINLLLPQSRRDGEYCGYLDSWWEHIVKRYRNNIYHLAHQIHGRYYAINVRSYLKHKTIELRQHSGTLNFEKLYNWITINQKWLRHHARSEEQKNTWATLEDKIELSMGQIEWMQQRRNELAEDVAA